MPHAVSMPSPGLQALILCGPGSSLATFTSNPDEYPKALLPIANRPMVWYPIEFCYRMGITNITLICPPSSYEAINTGMNTNPYLTTLPLPRPDIVAPADLDYNTGTASLLRLPEVTKLIEQDFVVLPCDLVCELGAHQILQAWMVKVISLAQKLKVDDFTNGDFPKYGGGLGVWYDTKSSTVVKGEETDFLATVAMPESTELPPAESLIPNLSRVVMSTPKDSLKDKIERKGGTFEVRQSLMHAHPNVRMRAKYRDAHIYMFPKWLLDFIQQNDHFETLGEDVVGWWAKATWQPGLAQKLKLQDACEPPKEGDDDSSANSTGSPREASPDGQPEVRNRLGSLASAVGRMKISGEQVQEPFEVPPIVAYAHQNGEGKKLIRRADTAPLLLNLSLQLAKLPTLDELAEGQEASPLAHAKRIAYPEGIKTRTTISKLDCLIGENTTVEEKTSIKECVIGANCTINEGAKLANCLIMDGVTVGRACKLTRCILGKRCVIGDGSVLTDVEVQENLIVEKRSDEKDTKLMSSEGLEATEAEMDEVMQEMDDAAALQEQ